MRFFTLSISSLSLTGALALGACGNADVATRDAIDVDALDEDSLFEFLNGPQATLDVLLNEVHISSRAAHNITDHVAGPDGVRGTSDDDKITSIAELDAIPQVGPATIETLEAYVRAHFLSADVTVEGVTMSNEVASGVMTLVNTETFEVLDSDLKVGLDARAADAIVAARPLADVHALAAVSYVGTSALTKLRDWVIAHPSRPPVGSAPQIVTLTATLATDVDPVWEETMDGARVEFTTRNVADCNIEIVSRDGDVIVSRDNVGREGPYFVGEWNSADPNSPWCAPGPQAAGVICAGSVDVRLTCHDGAGRTVDATTHASSAPSAPAIDCQSLTGGTFDGVSYSADEECDALKFINFARFSQMGALTATGRRIAYDCGPSGACGSRTSQWTALSQFAQFGGVAQSTMSALKTASAGFVPDGLRWDTVASTWQGRATLVDQPVSMDNVLVVRRIADQLSASYQYMCVELRDTDGASNFLSACLQFIDADSAPQCNADPASCLDSVVGERVSIRGTLRRASDAPGGYRVHLLSTGPGTANPAALP